MALILIAVAVLLAGGFASWVLGSRERLSASVGVGAAVVGAGVAAIPAAGALAGWGVEPVAWEWEMPLGSLSMAMDALSAWFVLPAVLLPALAAVYGAAYMKHYPDSPGKRGQWMFYNLLTASMVVLLTARNGVLFLLAWEGMSVSSFVLVMTEGDRAEVRQAGWTYLVAAHLGAAALLVMFLLLGGTGTGLDFEAMSAGGRGGLILLLAVVGFGTKAGLVPMHVWLPEAHPAAPSHVSAVMSGVMIKTGIYGLLRTLTLLGGPGQWQEWWGWVLLGMGAASGVLGVLLALAQHDMKRMLAYSSVENVGIIAMALGLGVVGLARGNEATAALAFAGGLMHVVNHAVFKGLLFLGAGALAHAAGTREMDRLGGLAKAMPRAAACLLIGSAAISALPPLNGFAGEFLIYFGSLRTLTASPAGLAIAALVAVGALALIGGLAAACFTRAFGAVFLGSPRSDAAQNAHEPSRALWLPMAFLAAGCVALGLTGPWMLRALAPVVAAATGQATRPVAAALSAAAGPLTWVTVAAGVWLVLLALLALLRRRLLARRPVEQAGTWDCGYAAPSNRMQYTASSFAEPLTSFFRIFLRTRRRSGPPDGLFPRAASLQTHTPDLFGEGLYRPAFSWAGRLMAHLRWLQHGRLQLYVLYIVLTLLVLLAWKLG